MPLVFRARTSSQYQGPASATVYFIYPYPYFPSLAGYQWEEGAGQCYQFHPRGATWQGANQTCVAEGAALAVPNTDAEARLLVRLRAARQHEVRDVDYRDSMPLGFYWDQKWKTVDGTLLDDVGHSRWFPGWPRNEAAWPWGYMQPAGLLTSLEDRGRTAPFVCEGPRSTNAPSHTTPAVLTAAPFNVCEEMGLVGYQWEELMDQCYRFHGRGATWVEANATCAAEGAALAMPNSDEEAMLFVRLRDAHHNEIHNVSFAGSMPMGFYWDQTWKTNDGKPLEASGYSKWWPGWPQDEQWLRYGYLEFTGRLENSGNVGTTPFICEAPR